jgi:Glycosyltransferase sugar-binding region containing DXD motif
VLREVMGEVALDELANPSLAHDDNAAVPFPSALHQSWKTKRSMPADMQAWRRSWLFCQPDWRFKFYDDADNDAFLQRHAPWFANTWWGFSDAISRADCARYMYLWARGGVYADLDTLAIRPVERLLDPDYDVVLGLMSTQRKYREHSAPNAFMASKPNVRLWEHVLQAIRAAEVAARNAEDPSSRRVRPAEERTGPIALFRALQAHGHKFRVLIHSPELVFPFDWSWRSCDSCPPAPAPPAHPRPGAAARDFPFAHLTTFWVHSWNRGGDEEPAAGKHPDATPSNR